ncbi:hypothetical protein [Neisseria meningitidis]|uniref:hypothetical protein n=1 Tax=Neisseria meningitidis TaxID=487 RepID=UPI00067AF171|nr:hypothetical protein [Neisseria meningitidis]
MTVERFQLLPINAAISNPVIPSKTEKQNQKPKIVIPSKTEKQNQKPKIVIPAALRHSRESGNLDLLNFHTAFEYCRYPTVWIPAYAGMTAERFQLFLNKFLQRWIFRFPLSRE